MSEEKQRKISPVVKERKENDVKRWLLARRSADEGSTVERRSHLRPVAVALVVALLGLSAVAVASPPEGVTPTVLAQGTYDAFKVKSVKGSPVKYEARSKRPIDIIVRQHDYEPGGHSGWHTHPAPVYVTVLEGALTFYHYNDPTCTPHVVEAGEGYVDRGRGHIARNETDQPARDIAVIIAPVDGAFRGELDAPGPHCDF